MIRTCAPRVLPLLCLSICLSLVSWSVAVPPVEAQPRLAAPIVGDADVGFDDCGDGVIKDDGTVETGWGWVPSVKVGEYLQVFEVFDFPGPVAESVCVCWLRTRQDSQIDFDVVFYRFEGDLPAEEPFAAFPGSLAGVPQGVPGATFVEVETPVTLPNERVLIGVRWDATADDFFFVCADTTEANPQTEMFFRDDRAEEWESVLETGDPIFQSHRAIFVRSVAGEQFAIEVPTLPADGLLAFALVLLAAGWIGIRRRA